MAIRAELNSALQKFYFDLRYSSVSIHVFTFIREQVYRFISLRVYGFTSLRVYKFKSLQVYKFKYYSYPYSTSFLCFISR